MSIVLVRHGLTEWNCSKRCTGWTDIGLSRVGVQQSIDLANYLNNIGYIPSLIYSSYLKRSIETAKYIRDLLAPNLVINRRWRLNENHYGALQGMSINEIDDAFGEEFRCKFFNDFYLSPPSLTIDDYRHPQNDKLYDLISPDYLPCGESFYDHFCRVDIFWRRLIESYKQDKRSRLIVCHGNTIRAIMMSHYGLKIENYFSIDVSNCTTIRLEVG